MSILDVEPGCYAQEVVVFMPQQKSTAVIQLPHRFEHVKRIELLEYYAEGNPGEGGFNDGPGIYRLNLTANGLQDAHVASNTMSGDGFVFAIDGAPQSHVLYNFPRVVSLCHSGFIQSLVVTLLKVNPDGTVIKGDNLTHATFWFRIVCRDAKVEQQLQIPAKPALAFSGRNDNFYYPTP